MKGARMKAKRHSRKSCGQEWGQFIIHAYTHTQTGVTIKTVQLFSSESRIKRLSTPRDPWEPRTSWEEQGAHNGCHCQQCLLWLSSEARASAAPPVLWFWWLAFCPLALLFLMFASWSIMEELTNPGSFLMSIFYGLEGEDLRCCLIALSPLLLSLRLWKNGGAETTNLQIWLLSLSWMLCFVFLNVGFIWHL